MFKRLVKSLGSQKRVFYQVFKRHDAFGYIDRGFMQGYLNLGADVEQCDSSTNLPKFLSILKKFRPTHFVCYLQEQDRTPSFWLKKDYLEALIKYKKEYGMKVSARVLPSNMPEFVSSLKNKDLKEKLTDFYYISERPTEMEKTLFATEFVDLLRSPFYHGSYRSLFKNYLQEGLPILEEPHAADISYYRSRNVREINDIVYVGGAWEFKLYNMLPYVEKMHKAYGSGFRLYGEGWPLKYSYGKIDEKEFVSTVMSSKVNLAFHEPTQVFPFPPLSGNERIFKLLALNRFVISDSNPLLNYHFDIDKEIVVANSPEDMAKAKGNFDYSVKRLDDLRSDVEKSCQNGLAALQVSGAINSKKL